MQSTSLRGRLSRHLVAAAAVATTAGAASADIVWSGIVNLNIPSTTNGLYLNVLTGAYNVDGGGGSTVAGWDVNPWSGGALSFFNPANPTGGVYVRDASTTVGVSNLGFGTVIGEGSTYSSGGAQTTGAFAFNLNSSENLVGFRLFNEDAGTVHYGWMRIELIDTLNGQPRSVVEYAFESTAGASIAAGVVPAPGVLALLGLAGLAGSRRRRG